jgi:hypothetical protein
MKERLVGLDLALQDLLAALLPVAAIVLSAVAHPHAPAFAGRFGLVGRHLHALLLDDGLAVAAAVELALHVEARTLGLNLALGLTFGLALGALGLAFLAGRLAIVIVVVRTGQRGRRCGAGQKESEEDLTHDLHLSSYEVRSALSQMSRGLTVTEPFIQV